MTIRITSLYGSGTIVFSTEAVRIACAEDIQLPDANPYYGHINMDVRSYQVRKRSPHKGRVKLTKLTKNQFSVIRF